MKVGIVIRRFAGRWGGAERWTESFCKWLLQGGHEVHLVTQESTESPFPPGLHVHHISESAGRWRFAELAAERIPALRLDVVHDMGHGWHADLFHCHSGSPHSVIHRQARYEDQRLDYLAGRISALGPRHRQLVEITRRQVAHQPSAFLMVSKLVAEDFRRWHEVPIGRQHLVYNGVDIGRFHPPDPAQRQRWRQRLGVQDDELLILFVGNNYRLKGLQYLLRAAARLQSRFSRFRIHVLGRDAARRWQRTAHSNGLDGRIAFEQHAADPVGHYQACDVFALPSQYDSCSLTVLEAMATGRPVITTATNGAAERVMHGHDGFVLGSCHDVDALADSLFLLTDQDLRVRMGAAARDTACRHTQEDNFNEVLGIYLNLRTADRPPAPLQSLTA